MLYMYGLKLGIKLLLHGFLMESIRYLIKPVNYWRSLEYPLVSNELNIRSGDKVLDVSSPKLLSIYLAKYIDAKVYSTDIDDYFVRQYSKLRKLEQVPFNNFQILIQDGVDLSFKDACFDKIYSISVLEHIPNDGDSACMLEIGRVLAKGGICVITVPFSPTSSIESKQGKDFYWSKLYPRLEDGTVFYQRKYSEADLYNRLIYPSGLKLKKILYLGENIVIQSVGQLEELMPSLSGPIQPILSKIFLKQADDWKKLKNPLCALIVLEKEH